MQNSLPISIMIVDDSAVMRGLLGKVLEKGLGIRIVANALDGEQAIIFARSFQPQIILLDVEMPVMDGIVALPKILLASPKSKVIMVSAATLSNAEITFEALRLGAIDYIQKPSSHSKASMEEFYAELLQKIQALLPSDATQVEPISEALAFGQVEKKFKALAIASSTGGPNALFSLFEKLAGRLAHIPIFITQHMPETFTQIMAANIAKVGRLVCKEGEEGEAVQNGTAYIAPGGYHMAFARYGSEVMVRLNQDAPVNFCRPSADVMFTSLAKIYGEDLLGLVLTGMGQDGAEGAKIIAQNGGSVIAESKQTAAVYGMPKAAYETGVCSKVLPLHEISNYLVKAC